MKAFIVGYGYTGKFLADHLLTEGYKVQALSRTNQETLSLNHPGFKKSYLDLDKEIYHKIRAKNATVFYLAPPNKDGKNDERLRHFIGMLTGSVKAIVYFSATSVYGDQEGGWIDETTPVNPENARGVRRLDAETQLQDYCQMHQINLSILRVSGIYGPGRLPINHVKFKKPIIDPEESPYGNHIHVTDLVKIAISASKLTHGIEIYNVADGDPQRMGYMQQVIAEHLGIRLPKRSFLEIFKNANPLYREFLSQSKRINNAKIKTFLKMDLQFPTFKQGILHELRE